MKKFLSGTEEVKGAVSLSGLASVIMAISVIILAMVLSAFVIVESNVKTDVYAQIDSRDRNFEALATHAQIISFNNTHDKISEYLRKPGQNSEKQLKNHLRSASSFINQSRITIVEREYEISLKTPESGKISVKTPETSNANFLVKSYIASPKKKPGILTTSVGG